MTKFNQTVCFKTFFALPFLWLFFTLCPTCITWWAGSAIYFIYLLFMVNLIGAIFVFKNYKNFYLLMCVIFTISLAFDFFGMLLIFFPRLNTHTLIFLSLSPTDSLIMVILLFSSFAFLAINKIRAIDYDAMRKEAYKNGSIDKLDGLLFVDSKKSEIAALVFKETLLSKCQQWITPGIVVCALVALTPFRVLGSVMERNGNTPLNAIFFVIAGYVILWVCYLCAFNGYAQYQLIKKIEQDLHIELKPVFKTPSTSF